jgi:hypothetical protein
MSITCMEELFNGQIKNTLFTIHSEFKHIISTPIIKARVNG